MNTATLRAVRHALTAAPDAQVTAGQVAVTYGVDRAEAAAILDGLAEVGAVRYEHTTGTYRAVPGEKIGVALAVIRRHAA